MILLLKHQLNEKELQELKDRLLSFHDLTCLSFNKQNVVITANDAFSVDRTELLNLPYVDRIVEQESEYPLASRLLKSDSSLIAIGPLTIGGQKPLIMAGPCAVESYQQVAAIAQAIAKSGAAVLRAGSYKPRSSPYSFQGLGEKGLEILRQIKKEYQLPIVSEIVASEQLAAFSDVVDILQVGARNMQNYQLLKALAKSNKPVLLKRNPANTIDEWLLSAEYLLAGGNPNVILCERGSKTFDSHLPVAFNLNIVSAVKKLTHLPLIADPSHASGDYKLAETIALSAILAGADGLLVEVHDQPDLAVTDGKQSLSCENFQKLMDKLATLTAIKDEQRT